MLRLINLRPIIRPVVLLVLLSSANVRSEPPVNSGGYQDLLNERLSSVRSLSADFRQFTSSRERRFSPEQTGKLWVDKPDKFRIVTEAPWEQVLVSDGESFWSWDAELEQVIVRTMSKDVREVPVLLFGGDASAITESFRVSQFEEEQRQTFVLEPLNEDGLFASLTIIFEDGVPAAIGIQDNLGQQTRIELIEPKINGEIDPATFEFNAPDGVDVIDER